VQAFKVVHEQTYFMFFFTKKYIHSYDFYLSGSVNELLNFCAVYFPCWFLKMAIILSHSHFLQVAVASILVFQTFDRIIFGTLNYPGTRWYVLTARDPQMVRDQKKFRNHWYNSLVFKRFCSIATLPELCLKIAPTCDFSVSERNYFILKIIQC